MKICFVSDMHTDIGSQPSIKWQEADVLLVAGDTANTIGDTIKFLRKTQKRKLFKHILFIDGNHEHYSNAPKVTRNNAPKVRTIEETLQRLDEQKPQGTILLSRQRAVKIGEFYFVGRCGWYTADAMGDPADNRARWFKGVEENGTNDNKWVGFSRLLGEQPLPWELAELHAREIDEIISETVAADPEARFIVATHMAPTRTTLKADAEHMFTNPFYCNLRLEPVLEKHAERIVAWHHGHTHYRQDRYVHGVYVVVNPRGYPLENPRWEPVVIEF